MPIVCHFYASNEDCADKGPQVHLINCNQNVSFNNAVVSEIVFNYSKSTARHLTENKRMPNSDSDIKTLLAYTDCSDAHPFEDLAQLVPLVQALEEEVSLISTWPHAFQGNWGVSLFDK